MPDLIGANSAADLYDARRRAAETRGKEKEFANQGLIRPGLWL